MLLKLTSRKFLISLIAIIVAVVGMLRFCRTPLWVTLCVSMVMLLASVYIICESSIDKINILTVLKEVTDKLN